MIRTDSLSFKYPDGTIALQEITLEIRNGEFLALMGPNGCGKTTLLKHLVGLLKPSSGKIWLDGKEIGFLKDREIFGQVGMVFQDPNDQLFASTVEDDIAFGPTNLGLSREEIDHRTSSAIKLVGLDGLFDRAIHTLSFGQKRRAAIAGVLALHSRTILLDEPTAGLDPRGISAVMHLLRILNREQGITIVMATHDVELVSLFCDRIIIMSHGKIIGIGTPKEIFTDGGLARVAGLRLPRMAHLAEILLKEDGVCLENMPLTIGQARREFCRLLKGNNGVNESEVCSKKG
ncbi:MAG: ATP-binding cassette domain-containing protein [Actinobacteria bacterium]|nr:ATP-binding cassette domain-containing protein [Actinomycetota bacterium]